MNLFCFTLTGSSESVYEPTYDPTPKELLPEHESSPALLSTSAEWASNPSVHTERRPSAARPRRDGGSCPCSSLRAASHSDLGTSDVFKGPSRSSDTPTRRGNVTAPATRNHPAAQGSDARSQSPVSTQSSGRLKKLHNLVKESKRAQQSGAGRRGGADHWPDAVSTNSMLTCIGLGSRTETKAPEPNGAPEEDRGLHDGSEEEPIWTLRVGNPPWSSYHCPQAWTPPLYSACHHLQHDLWTCGATMSLPRKTQRDRFESLMQELDGKQSVPQMIRSITDLQLSQNRSPGFGRSDPFGDRSPFGKPPDDCCLKKQEWDKEMNRSRQQRSETAASPWREDTDAERSLDGSVRGEEGKAAAERTETRGGRPPSGVRRTSSRSVESLFSLNSGQSSSSGVTSESDCSSNRNSLRLDDDLRHAKAFCGRARVHTEFVPSPYDTESLKLKHGDIIDIVAKPPMGIWKGVLHGRTGSFKFIYVDLLPEESLAAPTLEVRHKSPVQEVLKRLGLEEYSSCLRQSGFQTAEDLMRLREHHLLKLKVTHPEHRQRLLAAIYSLRQLHSDHRAESGGGGEEAARTKADLSNRPRDSGCHMSPESAEDVFPEDAETLSTALGNEGLQQLERLLK